MDEQVGGSHYKELAIQPMEYSMRNNLNACQHTAIKYITRYKDKGGRQDIMKAIHCLEMLIAMEYPAGNVEPPEGDIRFCEGDRDTNPALSGLSGLISRINSMLAMP